MKKSLLLALAMVLGLSASAQYASTPNPRPVPKKHRVTAPQRAEGSLNVQDCGDPDQALGINAVSTIGAAMPISASRWAGFKVTSIGFAVGDISATEATVFISRSLTSVPVYTQTVTLNGSSYDWQDFVLDTPYVIPTSGTIYVGYVVNATASEYAVVTDGEVSGGNYIGYAKGNDASINTLQWSTMSAVGNYGQTCVRAVVTGELPDYSASISNYEIPTVVSVNQEFAFAFEVFNSGSTPITSVDVKYTFDGTEKSETVAAAEAIESGKNGAFLVSGLSASSYGLKDLSFEVTALNDEPYAIDAVEDQVVVSALDDKLMMVCEEPTGNNCGYCPIGIVGLDYMNTNYPDDFIGIAVHCTALGSEPMAITNYNDFVLNLINGIPTGIVNRQLSLSPSPEYLEYVYQYLISGTGTVGAISFAEAEWTDGTMSSVRLKSSSKFGLDQTGATYRVAYVMTENQVGPYVQSNYFAGGDDGPMGGWENRSGSAPWLYDDVARYISDPYGSVGTIPSTVAVGETYEYESNVPTTGLKNSANAAINVNPENTEFIALLLEYDSTNKFSYVVNAAKIKASDVTFPEGIADQTVTWNTDFTGPFYPGDEIQLDAVASSDLPVTYQLACAPTNAATLTDNVLTIKREGTIYITAVQEGNATLRRASTGAEFTVVKDPQTITWDQDINITELNVAYPLEATASSGLDVKFTLTSSKPSGCASVSNSAITFKKEGTATVKAAQSGNDHFAAAESITRTIVCDLSGIENIAVDALPADARFYNLQGVEVKYPTSGNLYIVVSGGQAIKVLTK